MLYLNPWPGPTRRCFVRHVLMVVRTCTRTHHSAQHTPTLIHMFHDARDCTRRGVTISIIATYLKPFWVSEASRSGIDPQQITEVCSSRSKARLRR